MDNLHDEVSSFMRKALKERRQNDLSAVRLIYAAIKDQDIALRSNISSISSSAKQLADGNETNKDTCNRESRINDSEIVKLLIKMRKQRLESIAIYQKAKRDDLVEKEQHEVRVIELFLPKLLSREDMQVVVCTAVEKTQASQIKDIGRVMRYIKEHHCDSHIDMSQIGVLIKEYLGKKTH